VQNQVQRVHSPSQRLLAAALPAAATSPGSLLAPLSNSRIARESQRKKAKT